MMARRKRTLTKAELRAMGASPGLMAHRIGPDGRAEVRQLTSDSSAKTRPRPPFGPRLTDGDEFTQDDERRD